MSISSSLVQRDAKVLWHPYTQHGLEAEFLPVVTAQGAWLTLENGKRILDAISSWWVNLHGHAHPAIAKAISDQVSRLEHVMFAGFTHEPAVKLAEILIHAVQARNTELSRCFYSDNGSTAVEAAMKMAYQYYKNRGIKTRQRFISFAHAFHGETLGSMALSERGSYHRHFSELLPAVDFVPANDITALAHYLDKHPEEYAALMIEPMVQGSAGMRMHSSAFLAEVAALCKKAGVLLICDEVFTGFYRTGRCFAFEHANIKPDLLCLSKGITGGFLPLGATLTTEEIFSAFRSTDMNDAFLHGHAFTANPIACAAGITSWELLHQSDTQHAIQRISQLTQTWVERLSQHRNCREARFLGTIGAIELRDCSGYFSNIGYKIRHYAIERNVLLRILPGPVLYAVPPYCITPEEVAKTYETIESILNEPERFT